MCIVAFVLFCFVSSFCFGFLPLRPILEVNMLLFTHTIAVSMITDHMNSNKFSKSMGTTLFDLYDVEGFIKFSVQNHFGLEFLLFSSSSFSQ